MIIIKFVVFIRSFLNDEYLADRVLIFIKIYINTCIHLVTAPILLLHSTKEYHDIGIHFVHI